MLNTFTVSFFGNRFINENIDDIMDKLLYQIITDNNYTEFLVGRDGDFDIMVASAVRRAKKRFANYNFQLVWVMPYLKSEYKNNANEFDRFYDIVEICELSEMAYPKAAIQIRNKNMIDRSDFCVFYVKENKGGAFKTMQYAIKRNKNIINLASKK